MTLTDGLAWLLVIMAALPVAAAVALAEFWWSDIKTARERAQLAVLLAALAVVTAVLALNRVWHWGLAGEAVSVPYALILVLLDLNSGRWLWRYWTGGFSDRGVMETDTQRQDREVGDERRELQAREAEDQEGQS